MRAYSLIQVSMLAATALVAACGSPTDPREAPPILLAIKPTNATLLPGRKLQLNATLQGGEDSARSPVDVVWSSTDDRVATVTADGLVTANGNGAAQIAAWWEGHRAFATVNVLAPAGPPPCGHVASVSLRASDSKRSLCSSEPSKE